jgi:DNA-binding transcriptional LysR family regulator
VMLMVSPKNPLAKYKSVSTSEIAQQPLIFPKTGSTRKVLERHFKPYKSQLRVTMELPSVSMIKRFVAAGLGVSLISESFARDEVRAGKVKLIAIDGVELSRELGLIYRKDRSLPRSTAAFISLSRKMAALEPTAD